jgi:23S rRNA (uracil1939-C5)-methyltransferase
MPLHPKKWKEPREMTISALDPDGYGVDESGEYGVFGALPGETVVMQPFTRKKKRIYGRPNAIENSSPDRVVPPCQIADRCGGCSFQHVEPGRQIAFKQRRLMDALEDCEPGEVLSPLTGPVSNYRYKARLGVKFVEKKNKVLVGFREKMSSFIAETDRCEILASPVGGLLGELSELVASLSVRRAVPQIEVAIGDERAALVFRHLEDLLNEDTAALTAFSAQHGVDIYLQPGKMDSVWKLAPDDGVELLSYRLHDHDVEMFFHPLDFTQVNPAINRKLLEYAIGMLEPTSNDRVLDLFCGIGNFSLPLSRQVHSVVGVELMENSVARARWNASKNDISNCEFRTEDLFRDDVELPEARASKVLLDPPRSGAEQVCKRLAERKVEKVVYVSCNPLTLARDAKVLVESGYQLDKAGVIDMFPHTTHVESIACFSYKL